MGKHFRFFYTRRYLPTFADKFDVRTTNTTSTTRTTRTTTAELCVPYTTSTNVTSSSATWLADTVCLMSWSGYQNWTYSPSTRPIDYITRPPHMWRSMTSQMTNQE